MEAAKTIKERFAEARQLEQAGEPEQAAALYQKVVESDPDNQPAVTRLLVIYRKLKDYRKELAVIDTVLAVFAQRDKDLQAKWIKAHPKAAGASRSMVKQLGGARVSAFGVNPVVSALLKRREIVVRRLGGRKGKAASRKKAASRGKAVGISAAAARKNQEQLKREAAAAERRAAAERMKAAAEQRKQKARAEREAAAEARRADAEQIKLAALRRKEAAEQQKQAADAAKAEKQPSLFVISVRYLVALDKIDAAMPLHVAFLKKYYDKGAFIVSGRQVPRTGGIIIARGKSLDAVERLMKNDPFVNKKLASVDIIEFKASQIGKGTLASQLKIAD